MGNFVYDLVLLEADRIMSHRMQDFDLYYKDANGGFEKLAEAYEPEVMELLKDIFKRKRTSFCMLFSDSIDGYTELSVSEKRMLNFLVKTMNYGNAVSGYTIRDFRSCSGMRSEIITRTLKSLCAKGYIKYTVYRAKRTYMVNPSVFYRGSLKKLAYATKAYERIKSEHIGKKMPVKKKAVPDIFG
jgi:DNA-binding MarR family transcriptional regulator